MTSTVETMGPRDRPADHRDQLFGDGWPTFITADQVVTRHIGTVRRLFADLELVLPDEHDVPGAAGWAVPVRWDGTPEQLPDGYTVALVRAVQGHEQGRTADTLVVRPGPPGPARPGPGRLVLDRDAPACRAARLGASRRPGPPTLKSRYPLTPIEQFATWTRNDGLPLDPWLRTHIRLGAPIIATGPRRR
ncbi:MAG: hypothetical protein L0H79_21605 [Intrasporangium sp.]|uniref:hypothetical protein n=1 Tax=Intrasporangium sp. TaxID=1925024 RepID=UPI00264A01BC|nr:hypothetical protein [Intrasporangium sp.]MDN5798325.1 hypothetical protein [Intrasporangium sp.]